MKDSTMRFLSDKIWEKHDLYLDFLCSLSLSLIITSFAHQFCTMNNSGACVRLAEEQEIPLDQLTFEQLRNIDSRFTEDVMKVWDYEMSVERKCSVGGTSKARVLEQIEKCLTFAKAL